MNPILSKILASLGWLVLFAFLLLWAASSLNFEYNPVGSTVGLSIAGFLSVCWLWMAWKTLKKWINTAGATAIVAVLVVLYSSWLWVAWVGARS